MKIANNQSSINAALAYLQYVPDLYANDNTGAGVENMTIYANDFGHTGKTTYGTTSTLVVPLHVIRMVIDAGFFEQEHE